ncbi:hypothetical protein NIES2104_16370 [Leptolyngbya sp. NIES-2104]|nr:hypothetical protein NIES2104_16370 [Leptolyngbya sp. NIES-2104]
MRVRCYSSNDTKVGGLASLLRSFGHCGKARSKFFVNLRSRVI